MTATPTGRLGTYEGQDTVVFERTFRAPIDDVWAAVTESERLERWIGTWRGDPASGVVQFQLNAEGDDVPESTYEIQRCEPPRLLHVRAADDHGVWTLIAELSETAEAWGFRLMQQEARYLDRETVARRWYAEEYRPVVRMLEQADLIGDRTEAEAYLHLACQRYRLMRTHRWDDDVVDRLRADPGQ